MKRLRIVHTESSCGWGGQELRVLEESAGMMARGHDVLIATPPEAPIATEASRRGIPVSLLAIGKKRLNGIFALRRTFGAHRTDVVVTHSSTDSWLAALACLGAVDRPPIVRTRHVSAPIPQNLATRWLYGTAAAHVVTTGEALRRQVMQEAGLPADRVSSVPTGIDLDIFRPGEISAARTKLDLPQRRFVVGIVATLRSWKGHRFLVEALAAMKDESVLLVIVGDGPGRANLTEQVRLLGLTGQVVMAGQQRNVSDWLQALDAFVLPSYANEGVPQALMQAMACGVPVITTPVGAIGEIVSDGQTGLMVPPRDVAALALALAKLRDNPALRRTLADEGLLQARTRFSSGQMLDAMEQILNRTVAR
jgi:glycosyltransferase involved in cell wall biosynthesis